MKLKVAILGSAKDTLPDGGGDGLCAKCEALARAIVSRGHVTLTGATSGIPFLVGKFAHDGGGLHIGISPASNEREHSERFDLPTDGCDVLIYTGFGLKGRNVVLVRSCDIAIFVGGSIGSLNELTIAYDEGRIIGCLTGSGGVADKADQIFEMFPKKTRAVVLHGHDPERLVAACVEAWEQRQAS